MNRKSVLIFCLGRVFAALFFLQAIPASAQETCSQWKIDSNNQDLFGYGNPWIGPDKPTLCTAWGNALVQYLNDLHADHTFISIETDPAYISGGMCRLTYDDCPNWWPTCSRYTAQEVYSTSGTGDCSTPQHFPNLPEKTLGQPQQCRAAPGNPCDATTGNKFQRENDVATGIALNRYYNSRFSRDLSLGVGWTSSIHARLEIIDAATVVVRDFDGRGLPFSKNGLGQWTTDADIRVRLSQDSTGYTLERESSASLRFNTAGVLTSAQDAAGRVTTYAHNSGGQLVNVTDPFGKTLTVTYTSSGLIDTVTDAGGGVTDYSYSQVPITNSYRGEVVADRPLGYWRLGDTSGSTAAHEFGSGQGGNGGYAGSVTLNQSGPGAGSTSVAFDASGDGEVWLSTTRNITSAFTLEIWVNPDATQPDDAHIFTKRLYWAASESDFPVSLRYSTTAGFAFGISKGNDFAEDLLLSSGAVTAGQWYHVVAVYRKNGHCELWINGTLIQAQDINFFINPNSHYWKLANATEYPVEQTRLRFQGNCRRLRSMTSRCAKTASLRTIQL